MPHDGKPSAERAEGLQKTPKKRGAAAEASSGTPENLAADAAGRFSSLILVTSDAEASSGIPENLAADAEASFLKIILTPSDAEGTFPVVILTASDAEGREKILKNSSSARVTV